MPKRQDLKRVMIISSGPIVIGQGCEFDYSGTQACKALREEGISVVLLNSNPATIMTDPELADRTYIEPINAEAIDKILGRERELGTPVDALLPTLGGQTGLNCAMEAAEKGILKKHNVQLIGANETAIHKAEDRTEFKNAMLRIGLDVPKSGVAHTWEESQKIVKELGLPVVIRPAYTLGGTGGGFATTMEEFETIAKRGLEYSRVHEILIEESALGWKEYELEVMRDRADNVVIICSIENFDAMGVHTGDSITVAPAQTLTDKEYQRMRDAAIKIIREIGVETGGSNVQFAVNPQNGRMIVVEMNPRVSRSSALASKATGYPIAKIAAKLAIGYTLDEIPNDITRATPASFEPTIDYCVVKIPRWTFEKFPEANETLTTQMKSVGEAMSIGRTFKEALQKGVRSMEIKRFGMGLDGNDLWLASCGTAFQAVNRNMGFQPMPQRETATLSQTNQLTPGQGQDAHARSGRGQSPQATQSWEHGEVQRGTGAYLPHWTAEGATYSVTFRLADSLPRETLEDFVRERDEILQRVAVAGRVPTIQEDQRLRELFSEKIESYLDTGRGECVLQDDRAAQIVRDALAHFHGQRYDVCAWCVMPNHVHVILRPHEGYDLSGILHSWKSFTSNQINRVLGRIGSLWQPEYFDHLIRDAADFERSVHYVLENPSIAGLKAWNWFGTGFEALEQRQNASATQKHGQDAHATIHGQDARATDEPVRIVKSRHLSEAPADTKEEHATEWPIPAEVLHDKLARPCQGRPYYIRYAFKMGWTVEQVHELTFIDPWFLENMKQLVEFEDELIAAAPDPGDPLGFNTANVNVFNQLTRSIGGGPGGAATATAPSVRQDVKLRDLLRRAKEWGYSDVQIAKAWNVTPKDVRWLRDWLGVRPVYKLVDTCAAEFEAVTPYYYSTYETPAVRVTDDHNDYASEVTGELRQAELDVVEDEVRISDKPKVIILGGGPNRIGQGIEFDYCCVHAVMQARTMGYETVMVNSNPETVSTDYDTSDLLFFEPLTHEDVLNICERLNGQPLARAEVMCGTGVSPVQHRPEAGATPRDHRRDGGATPGGDATPGLLKGVIVQYGGQTPLNLAQGLKDAGVPILGTSPESIHLAEDRNEFQKIVRELGLRQPEAGIAYDLPGAIEIADKLGYPVLVRPSYVLGGRGMEKCHIQEDLVRYMTKALDATDRAAVVDEKHPILIDKFLSAAVEVDVDCISDGKRAIVCGMMEHIEEAGIHSGDSACSLPPYTLSPAIIDEIKRQAGLLAIRLRVSGLMNVQFAVKDDLIYLIEVNPRASRTIPFVSKATGVPWAKLATKVMLGRSLNDVMKEQGIDDAPWPRHISVKEAVFPFNKFPEVDCVLGPEMRSTGEVMGIDRNFPLAFAKAQMAAGNSLPTEGTVLISVNDQDKRLIAPIAKQFHEMGFKIISTAKTLETLQAAGIPAMLVKKKQDPEGPYLIDMINNGEVDLLINTPIYSGSAAVESRIRSAAVMHNIPLVTTITGARSAAAAIKALREAGWGVKSIQEYHEDL